ncbi:MAG: alpha/beta hydrolase, partial [Bacteroidetes bacterium]|nr:alpha/beta hydrolase [Bacteroidota bacterium]
MYKIVANENVNIYTESFGTPDDIPILLIAGAMAPSVFWNDEFCLALSTKGYYVIRFDNRDIGRSTHFQQSDPAVGIKLPYSIEDMVRDAKVVL